MRIEACLTFSLLITLPACSERPALPAHQIVVARAQPSVLKVVSSFDARLTRMSGIGLKNGPDGKPLVTSEYARARAAGSVGPNVTQAHFSWARIAEAPDRYLQVGGKPVSFDVTDQPVTTGTAFVVDDAGTLLTNQHVIGTELVVGNPASIGCFAMEDVHGLLRTIGKLVGGLPADELDAAIDGDLIPSLLAKYKCSNVRFREARVTTTLLPTALQPRLLGIRKAAAPPAEWKKSTFACQVLAAGKPYPGKDVAVLRASSLASNLISLPLGDSARVVSGTKVYALGFPSAALIGGVDRDAARFRVIAHDGIVDQRLPLETGWEAFHMTANTNHGQSGGPVIDESGHVVGIVVAGNDRAASQNLAIPIAIGKEFLAKAGVVPRPRSDLTETWYRACDEFQRQRYAAALALFEKVNNRQGAWLFGEKTGQATELIRQCRAQIDAGRGGSSWGTPGGWWQTAVQTVSGLPIAQKTMLGLGAIVLLGGLLRLLRSILVRLGDMARR